MASEEILTITQANFQKEVLESPIPVLVDFWAVWCGPCKMIGPVLDEIAPDYKGRARIGKVNVDQEQSLATQFGVTSIPTLFIFKGGQVIEQMVGLRSKRDLRASLDKAVV
jgi:thioredoxin 1